MASHTSLTVIRCIKPFYWRIKPVSKLTNWKKMSHWIKQLDKLEKCIINIEFASSFIVINGCKMCCITLITNVKWVFPSLDYDLVKYHISNCLEGCNKSFIGLIKCRFVIISFSKTGMIENATVIRRLQRAFLSELTNITIN